VSSAFRPNAIPETGTIDTVVGLQSNAIGIERDEFIACMEEKTLRRQLPTLSEVADAAVLIASDRARAMTEAVANLSGGSLVD